MPPPAIAANRTRLATLVATNFLGINTPAIVATEAQYAEMWVQDATMMTAYQAASAAAAVLQPLPPPSPAPTRAARRLQAASVAQATHVAPPHPGRLTSCCRRRPGHQPRQLILPAASSTAIDGFLGTPPSSMASTAESTPRPGSS